MHPRELHRRDVSPEETIAIQNRLRGQLDLQSEPERIEIVAGIDVSYDKGSDWLFAAITATLSCERFFLVDSEIALDLLKASRFRDPLLAGFPSGLDRTPVRSKNTTH